LSYIAKAKEPEMKTDIQTLIIREAQPTDAAALQRLAELDSGRVPRGRLLVAEAEGQIQAAVPLAGGPAIADPFRSTAAIVSLLGLRAAQLRGLARRRGSDGQRRHRPAFAAPAPARARARVAS
jgi:hypothetical protein